MIDMRLVLLALAAVPISAFPSGALVRPIAASSLRPRNHVRPFMLEGESDDPTGPAQQPPAARSDATASVEPMSPGDYVKFFGTIAGFMAFFFAIAAAFGK